MLKQNHIVWLFLLLLRVCYGQQVLEGDIIDMNGLPIMGAVVRLDEKNIQLSDDQGHFVFENMTSGKHKLKIEMFGFQDVTQEFSMSAKKNYKKIVLTPNVEEISEVVIHGRTKAEKIKEQGFAVEVVEVKNVKNLSTDISQVLKAIPGVNLRESGGLGSNFKLSLNGLSGNQIRYFIDGVAMENFGSSLTLNNFPVNLVERVEIYKGVVPIELGADALGGAINVITANQKDSYLDASYSTGSFNTHRVAVNAQAIHQKKYYAKLFAFFNYSDNDYLMKGVPVYDLDLGNFLGQVDVKRFHDQYISNMITTELGVFDKKIADQLYLRFSATNNKNEYQHPDNNILRALGEFHTKDNTYLISTRYKKSFEKLKLNFIGLIGKKETISDDTSTRRYNWTGSSIEREEVDLLGELGTRRSLFRLNDNLANSQFNIKYTPIPNNFIEFNHAFNYLKRIGKDDVNPNNIAFRSPTTLLKNVLGISYMNKSSKGLYDVTAFVKNYLFSADKKSTSESPSETNINFSNTGFGATLAIYPFEFLTVKSSYEKGFRVPEIYELLGNGLFIRPNLQLQPELSDNYNFGFRLKKSFSRLRFMSDTNLFYRKSKDFIRLKTPEGVVSEYDNIVDVDSKGIEVGAKVTYLNLVELHYNITYQDIIDKQEFDEGIFNDAFNTRVPNIPYLFWNSRIGAKFFKGKLDVYWNYSFIESFALKTEKNGNEEDKNMIPSQRIHGLDISYSWKNGRYNVSGAMTNLTDALAYDNFRIQKPGRAFYLKFRYHLK